MIIYEYLVNDNFSFSTTLEEISYKYLFKSTE